MKKMNENQPCPEKNASILSKVFFSWFTRIFFTGYKRPLEKEDLWELDEPNTAEANYQLLSKHLKFKQTEMSTRAENQFRKDRKTKSCKKENEKLIAADETTENAQRLLFFQAILKTYAPCLLVTILSRSVILALRLANPEILRRLLSFISTGGPQWKGYLIAGGFFLVCIIRTFASAQYFKMSSVLGMRLRSALSLLIYRKALVLSNSAMSKSTTGELVNLLAVDTRRLASSIQYINTIWAVPVLLILAVYFMWNILGCSVFAGLAVILMLVPLNTVFGKTANKIQIKEMKAKDKRTKLTNEILSGIKAIKMHAWEVSFQDKIAAIRSKELGYLKKCAYLLSCFFVIYLCTPFFVSLAMFGSYMLIDARNSLDAKKIFVSIALVNSLKFPLIEMSQAVSALTEAYVSFCRVVSFLSRDELKPMGLKHDVVGQPGDAIVVENANFRWNSDEPDTLSDVSMSVREGSLVAVVGQVGCGKSSLMSALLGDMEKTKGRVAVKGTVAYVPQIPWIQNLSVCDNITFGKIMDILKYQDAIRTCELVPDLDMLSHGDQTEIGERGLNLSGGQKQRVSLARAVYQDREIYLFDDPLSAVDAHVGKNIFDHVIGPDGCLKTKTRILVTHALSYLSQVDQIFVLVDGRIKQVTTYSELLTDKSAFSEILKTCSQAEQSDEDYCEKCSTYHSVDSSCLSSPDSWQQPNGDLKATSKLTDEETPRTGNISMAVLKHYIKFMGYFAVSTACLAFFLQNATIVVYGIWLAEWSNDPKNPDGTQNGTALRIGVYAGLGGLQGVFVLLQSVLLYICGVRASTALHKLVLSNILRCPMRFFDRTPTGRILNRFSVDMDSVDHLLINALLYSLNSLLYLVGAFFTICYSTPLYMVAVIPICFVYLLFQRFYTRTSRQLKRLISVTSSPIYSHFTETLSGVSVIRAYQAEDRFVTEDQTRLDAHFKVSYAGYIAIRWLAFRLNLVGTVLVTLAAMLAVANKDRIGAGYVGLSITFAMQITVILNRLVLRMSDLESRLVAVERIHEYSMLEAEAPLIEKIRPPDDWPSIGGITFERYSTKYRDELDLVVKDISFDIKGGEKISVVGRTGAGKSSLTLALFRIIEAFEGRIVIDGLDIATIGLQDLRQRISILPQDPVLFSGTLRVNLDPFDEHSDEELWDALEHTYLKDFVTSLPLKLECKVAVGGTNLSVGQRQLVCLARALLNKSKILVLDEATAAVDLETDGLIQSTIRSKFADCTTFTIAHRLNTIMDSTRILVLDAGQIVEFDTPDNLLKAEGVFHAMAKDAGLL